MAFFPSSPQQFKDAMGNYHTKKDKKGNTVYNKSVNTDDWVKDGKGGYRERKKRTPKASALKKRTKTAFKGRTHEQHDADLRAYKKARGN